MNTDAPLLETRGIAKHFGSIEALTDINLTVQEQEIVGLVGDNGAGKSTFIKILSGNFPPDSGEIYFEGKPTTIRNPHEAKRLGIETVYQDLALCENLDIPANFFLGRELTRTYVPGLISVLQDDKMRQQTRKALDSLRIDIPELNREIRFLSGGQRQCVAIGRAAAWGAKLLLLDEPTAALGARETKQALEMIAGLREETDVGIIMISHNLHHVLPVSDRIVVFRHGAMVGNFKKGEITADELIEKMTS